MAGTFEAVVELEASAVVAATASLPVVAVGADAAAGAGAGTAACNSSGFGLSDRAGESKPLEDDEEPAPVTPISAALMAAALPGAKAGAAF